MGLMPELADQPDAAKWGSLNLGGSIVTAGGLVFIGAARDNYLRGFDVETGVEIWKGELPAGGQATPSLALTTRSDREAETDRGKRPVRLAVVGCGDVLHRHYLGALEAVGTRDGIATKVVLVDGAVRLTGLDLLDRVRALAGGLRRAGVGPGDAVAFQTPSWWETVATYRACWRLGAVAAPIHHLASDADIDHALGQVGPKVLLASAELPAARRPGAVQVRGDGGFESLLDAPPVDEVASSGEDLAVVLFTSGSTGGPKGVLHSHVTLQRILAESHRRWRVLPGEATLMPSPVTHISGYANGLEAPLVCGTRTVLMESWNAEAAMALIDRHACVGTTAATPFLVELAAAARASGKRLTSFRYFACGEDLSHEPPDVPLPDAIATGAEPFLIVGALAGG